MIQLAKAYESDGVTDRFVGHKLKGPPPPGHEVLAHVRQRRALRRRVANLAAGLVLCGVGLQLREPRSAARPPVPGYANILVLPARVRLLTPTGLAALHAAVMQTRHETAAATRGVLARRERRRAVRRVAEHLGLASARELAWLERVIQQVRSAPGPRVGPRLPEVARSQRVRAVVTAVVHGARAAYAAEIAFAQAYEDAAAEELLAEMLLTLTAEELASVQGVVEEAVAIITGEAPQLTQEEMDLIARAAAEAKALGAQIEMFFLSTEYNLPAGIVADHIAQVAQSRVPYRDFDAYVRATLDEGSATVGDGLRERQPEAVLALALLTDAVGRAKARWLGLTYWEHVQLFSGATVGVRTRCSIPHQTAVELMADRVALDCPWGDLSASPEDIMGSPTRHADLSESAAWYRDVVETLSCPVVR